MKRLLTAVSLAALFAPAAHAVDGCKLLLCISGNWKSIPMCVPTVTQAFKDIAKGKAWPTCSMSGAGNNSNFQWANQTTCPPFYSQFNADSGAWQSCQYPALVSVQINNVWWSTVFADLGGGTSTQYSGTARTQLGASIDPTYDIDESHWVPPPPPPPCSGDSC